MAAGKSQRAKAMALYIHEIWRLTDFNLQRRPAIKNQYAEQQDLISYLDREKYPKRHRAMRVDSHVTVTRRAVSCVFIKRNRRSRSL